MSTASPEAHAQCAARLRILHRPGRSPRTQRNPGDQDRCRAAQRADVPRPTGSERTEPVKLQLWLANSYLVHHLAAYPYPFRRLAERAGLEIDQGVAAAASTP